ncbi:MAG: hypothetical protein ACREC8_11045, partial [Limisphaerales bacterium]
MNFPFIALAFLGFFLAGCKSPSATATSATTPKVKVSANFSDAPKFPREWIDPDTGHRVIQLSTEPGSESLYFNVNPFTPDGKEMVFTTPDGIS